MTVRPPGVSSERTQAANDKIDPTPTTGETVVPNRRDRQAAGTDGKESAPEAFTTRRRLLGTLTSAGVVGLAGCVGGSDDSGEEPTPTETIHPKLRVGDKALTDVFPVQLVDAQSEDVVGEVHWHGDEFSHWHFQPLEVPLGGFRNVRANFRDRSREPIPLGEDEQYHLDIKPAEESPSGIVRTEVNGNQITLEGTESGTATLIFHLVSDGERVWTSPLLEVEVADQSG